MKLVFRLAITSVAANSAAAASDQSVSDTLYRRLDVVTSAFQQQGGSCPAGKPKLVMDIVPTFGEYDGDRNELHITGWDLLSSEGKAHYAELVGKTNLADAQSIYESGNYQWVFVHELGHWWQHCTGHEKADPYAIEMGANRIASAYWRTANPELMAKFAEGFGKLTRSLVNTTPPDKTPRAYFDANYESLGRNPPAYIWFQAKMIVDAYNEHPTPTFREALQTPTGVPSP